jgi:hypothetical protein
MSLVSTIVQPRPPTAMRKGGTPGGIRVERANLSTVITVCCLTYSTDTLELAAAYPICLAVDGHLYGNIQPRRRLAGQCFIEDKAPQGLVADQALDIQALKEMLGRK